MLRPDGWEGRPARASTHTEGFRGLPSINLWPSLRVTGIQVDIFLIRHGEMEYEPDSAIDLDLINAYATGSKEGPLSQRGIGQAQRVAEYLMQNGVRTLYSSAFLRARQTAEETSTAIGRPFEIIKDLGELNVGSLAPDRNPLQARILRGFRRLHGVLPYLVGDPGTKGLLGYLFVIFYFRSWTSGKTVGGESRQDALRRIHNVFKELTGPLGPSDKVALFTHGYFIHLLVNIVLDPKGARLRLLKTPYIKNGSITHLNRSPNGRWMVRAYAHAIHLH